jgi:hypothetical protein
MRATVEPCPRYLGCGLVNLLSGAVLLPPGPPFLREDLVDLLEEWVLFQCKRYFGVVTDLATVPLP